MKNLALLGLAISLLSCTKEIDLPLPAQEQQLVLNGLLHPTQPIQVSLTTTLPSSTGATDFPVRNF